MKWRPFIEWRPSEIGIGFSFSVDRVHNYMLSMADPAEEKILVQGGWCPNIWIHIGPLVAGIGWESR